MSEVINSSVKLAKPSTDWKEQIAPDEAQRYAGYVRTITSVQALKSAKFGVGRTLHRKQLHGLQAQFEVLTKLPSYARHGLFEKAGLYEARVRLSNGGTDHGDDRTPDVRGFAIKVVGLKGVGALGNNATNHQDFLLINHPAFTFKGSDEFVGLVGAFSGGKLALLKYLFGRYGVRGGLGVMSHLAKTIKRPFSGFATEPFFSATPFACGPYAARMRLCAASSQVTAGASSNWADDISARLSNGPLTFDVQLQFYISEEVTPIEDASVDWPEAQAPYLTVARLTLPKQTLDADLAVQTEADMFDPWGGLMAHRPLGDVMRARKGAYFSSARGRGVV